MKNRIFLLIKLQSIKFVLEEKEQNEIYIDRLDKFIKELENFSEPIKFHYCIHKIQSFPFLSKNQTKEIMDIIMSFDI